MQNIRNNMGFFNSFRYVSGKGGFTLIEILIVVALLAILAVAALLAINPGEAQNKTRDAQRLKHMSALQAIVEQYTNDNPTATVNATSTSAAGSNSCAATGWFGSDLCTYANIVPVDPSNRTGSSYWTAGGAAVTVGTTAYQVIIGGGNYRICTKLQSKANTPKLTSDGGIGAQSNTYYEVFNNTTAATNCTF